MKFINRKSLVITCAVCLLPIFFGIALWNSLPETIAVHFNFNNEPDNFASKAFVVFGLPLLMAVLQAFCCITSDINSHKHGEYKKFERATKWIIPGITIILQAALLGYGLAWSVDIRRVATLIVGVVMLVLGRYLPELDYIKNYDIDAEKARKINRFAGKMSVIMGILILLTIALPPMFAVIWLFLLIPYTVVSVVYSIKVIKTEQ